MLNNEQAIKTLIQVAQLAQSRGILSLDDAVTVKSAIDVFIKPVEKTEEPVEEKKDDDKKD